MNMNSFLNSLFSSLRTPMCNTCKHKKRGLTTICHRYKRIPIDIQRGGCCEKYEGEPENEKDY